MKKIRPFISTACPDCGKPICRQDTYGVYCEDLCRRPQAITAHRRNRLLAQQAIDIIAKEIRK